MNEKSLKWLGIDKVIKLLEENEVKLRRSDFDGNENECLENQYGIEYKNCIKVIKDENDIIGVVVKVVYTGRWCKQLKRAKKQLLEYKCVKHEEHHMVFGFTLEELDGEKNHMNNQNSLFELLDKKRGFSWDTDINEIYDKLVFLVKKHNLEMGNQEFKIWGHVPQYGYRMTFTIRFCESGCTEEFLNDLQDIVNFAESRNIELSPMNGAIGNMYIFSTFNDKARRKIR